MEEAERIVANVSERMDLILGRISKKGKRTGSKSEDIRSKDPESIRAKVAKASRVFRDLVMDVAEGDVPTYRELMEGGIEQYLVKLDNFVESIEARQRS